MSTYDKFTYEFFQQTLDCAPNEQSVRATLRHGNVARYRVRTIRSGNVTEVEAYPIFKDYREVRAARSKITQEVQANLNDRNAKKHFVRLVNTNFVKDDWHVTLTYNNEQKLPDEVEALNHIQNYFRRVKDYCKKNELQNPKYLYVIEFADGDGWRKRIHHHIMLSGFVPRDVVRDKWKFGRVSCAELEPENGSLEGLARYITKQFNRTKQSKRWQSSRNLKKPTVTTSDNKLSKRQIEVLASDVENHAGALFTKLYPNLVLNEPPIVKRSDWVAGACIYAKLHKSDVRQIFPTMPKGILNLVMGINLTTTARLKSLELLGT